MKFDYGRTQHNSLSGACKLAKELLFTNECVEVIEVRRNPDRSEDRKMKISWDNTSQSNRNSLG